MAFQFESDLTGRSGRSLDDLKRLIFGQPSEAPPRFGGGPPSGAPSPQKVLDYIKRTDLSDFTENELKNLRSIVSMVGMPAPPAKLIEATKNAISTRLGSKEDVTARVKELTEAGDKNALSDYVGDVSRAGRISDLPSNVLSGANDIISGTTAQVMGATAETVSERRAVTKSQAVLDGGYSEFKKLTPADRTVLIDEMDGGVLAGNTALRDIIVNGSVQDYNKDPRNGGVFRDRIVKFTDLTAQDFPSTLNNVPGYGSRAGEVGTVEDTRSIPTVMGESAPNLEDPWFRGLIDKAIGAVTMGRDRDYHGEGEIYRPGDPIGKNVIAEVVQPGPTDAERAAAKAAEEARKAEEARRVEREAQTAREEAAKAQVEAQAREKEAREAQAAADAATSTAKAQEEARVASEAAAQARIDADAAQAEAEAAAARAKQGADIMGGKLPEDFDKQVDDFLKDKRVSLEGDQQTLNDERVLRGLPSDASVDEVIDQIERDIRTGQDPVGKLSTEQGTLDQNISEAARVAAQVLANQKRIDAEATARAAADQAATDQADVTGGTDVIVGGEAEVGSEILSEGELLDLSPGGDGLDGGGDLGDGGGDLDLTPEGADVLDGGNGGLKLTPDVLDEAEVLDGGNGDTTDDGGDNGDGGDGKDEKGEGPGGLPLWLAPLIPLLFPQDEPDVTPLDPGAGYDPKRLDPFAYGERIALDQMLTEMGLEGLPAARGYDEFRQDFQQQGGIDPATGQPFEPRTPGEGPIRQDTMGQPAMGQPTETGAPATMGRPEEALYKLPWYEQQVQERTLAARQVAANAGLSQSGRMVSEAAKISGDVLDTAYGRYMDTLSGMSQPQATTKIENLRMGYSAQGADKAMNEQLLELSAQRDKNAKRSNLLDFAGNIMGTEWFGNLFV